MKAAVLTELGKIEVIDRPKPQIVDDFDVQVKVKAVGICGTDLHMFKETRADVKLPRIMGHELSGVVTAVGRQVQRIKVGDHVALDPVYACDECVTCRKGHRNVCPNVKCYGVQMDGGFQEYIVTGEKHLYLFDQELSYEEAAVAEPFSIGDNILKRAGLTKADRLLIIGAGTIGLSVLQIGKLIGADVTILDVVPKKLNIAKELGADYAIDSSRDDLSEIITELCPDGYDVVVDAVGITPLFREALNYAAPYARVICIGFDARPAEIPPVLIIKKEIAILGSRMNNGRFPEVMEWLNSRKINAEAMITRRYGINEIQKAFEETLSDKKGNIKTMIVM